MRLPLLAAVSPEAPCCAHEVPCFHNSGSQVSATKHRFLKANQRVDPHEQGSGSVPCQVCCFSSSPHLTSQPLPGPSNPMHESSCPKMAAHQRDSRSRRGTPIGRFHWPDLSPSGDGSRLHAVPASLEGFGARNSGEVVLSFLRGPPKKTTKNKKTGWCSLWSPKKARVAPTKRHPQVVLVEA